MTSELAANVIGSLAACITGFQVARQGFDVYRTRRTTGVSLPTWELALVQSVGLLIVSVERDLTVAIGINAWVGVGAGLIMARTGPGDPVRQARRGVLLVVATVAVFAAIVAVAGPLVAGTVGAIGSAVVWIPQAVHSYRSRSSSGLSWASIGAGVISSGLWIAYAWLVGEWRLAVPPSSALISLLVTSLFGLAKASPDR